MAKRTSQTKEELWQQGRIELMEYNNKEKQK